MAAVVFVGAAPASAAGLGKPVIGFVSPSPTEGATVTTSSVQFAFTYNRRPTQTRTVACALSGPTSSSGCLPLAAAAGGSSSGASFSGLANGPYTLTVTVTLTDGGTVSAMRDFTVAAPIDVVVWGVQPTTTRVDTAMTPAVVVLVENSQGSLDSSFNGPVTLTYAVNPVGAPEPTNNVVDASGGIATFPSLTFSAVGVGFQLRASADQATSSPSVPFLIIGST